MYTHYKLKTKINQDIRIKNISATIGKVNKMQWLSSFNEEARNATDKQLKAWLRYMRLFKCDKNADITIYKRKREKYIEIITAEMKKRGIRQERSRERGKAKDIQKE